MSRPERPRTALAIGLTLTAIIGFDIMAIMVRLLSEEGYSPAELSAYRNVLGVLPSLVAMAWLGELQFSREKLRIRRWKLALFRGVIVAAAQLCFYTSLGLLELATVSALAQTNAIFVVLVSVVLLRERVGPWRLLAVALGFAGAIWILRPGSEAFTPLAILPILAALGYATSLVTVRLFDSSESSALLYVYSSVASAAGAILLALATTGFSPLGTGRDMALILAMSLSGGIAVLLLMFAYRLTMPSVLAPFMYVSLLTAFTFGWLVFGEAPIDTLFPGVLLIVAAGGVIIWREQYVRSRHRLTAIPPKE